MTIATTSGTVLEQLLEARKLIGKECVVLMEGKDGDQIWMAADKALEILEAAGALTDEIGVTLTVEHGPTYFPVLLSQPDGYLIGTFHCSTDVVATTPALPAPPREEMN